MLSIAISTMVGTSSIASADMIEFSFSAIFTLASADGEVHSNTDDVDISLWSPATSSSVDALGYYTEITGQGTYSTDNETGSYIIDPFSFFGGGAVYADVHPFFVIGDGAGGSGSLINTSLHFYQPGIFNSNFETPFISDASGFLNNLPAPGQTKTIGSACTACVTSTTADWAFETSEVSFTGSIGEVPVAMTNYNSVYPLVDNNPLFDDGVAGSPMTEGPWPGQNMGIDFTSITATNISAVPVPAAVWLFGSGLISLVVLARRKT